MGKTRRFIRYLSFQEIVELNCLIIIKTGGFIDCAGKIINLDSLRYLVDIVQSTIDDDELYSDIFQKAALYTYNIITRHIFYDGNKRTGMICAFYFLNLNGYYLSESITDNEIVNLALGIANGNIEINELTEWFSDNINA